MVLLKLLRMKWLSSSVGSGRAVGSMGEEVGPEGVGGGGRGVEAALVSYYLEGGGVRLVWRGTTQ